MFNSLSGDLQTDFDMKTSRDGRRGPIGANVRGDDRGGRAHLGTQDRERQRPESAAAPVKRAIAAGPTVPGP